MKFSFYNIPIPFTLKLLRRVTRVNPLIVNYHVVSDKILPYINNLYNYRDIRTFVADIDFLRRYYIPVGLHDLISSIKNNVKLPNNAVMLTFDDGFREVYDIIGPVLSERKLTATIFLTTAFLDNKELNYANKKSLLVSHLNSNMSTAARNEIINLLEHNQLKNDTIEKALLNIPYKKKHVIDELAELMRIDFQEFLLKEKPYLTCAQVEELINAGITVGGHSVDHPRFSELSPDEQIAQAVNSVRFLQQTFNLNYRAFAFPYTDMNISKNFFKETADEFDVTFGTQGMLKDCILNNIQRVNVEKFNQPVQKTLKSHYLRKYFYGLRGKDEIIRR